MSDDKSEPIVGHALVAIGQITEQEVKSNTMMTGRNKNKNGANGNHKKWKLLVVLN